MKREIENRPLLIAAFGLILGLTLRLHPAHLVLALLALLVVTQRVPILVLLISLWVGWVRAPEPTTPLRDPVRVEGIARVTSVPVERGGRTSFDMAVQGLRLRATAPAGLAIGLGDGWQVSGLAKPPSELWEAVLIHQGLQGEILLGSGLHRVSEGPRLYAVADNWRRSYQAFASQNLSEGDAQWLDAIAFRSGQLGPDDLNDLKSTGTLHLVAASGLQVGVLAGLGWAVLALVPVSRPYRIAVVTGLLVLYALATGLHMSTVRATAMVLLVALPYLAKREPDSLSALAFCAFVFALLQPQSVYDLGFQLSVAIVTCLVLFGPAPRRHRNPRENLQGDFARSVAVGVLAAVVSEPLVAAHTGFISLAGAPTNVFAVLPALVALGASMLAYAVAPVLPPVAVGTLHVIVAPSLHAVREVVHWGSSWTVAKLPVPGFDSYLTGAFYFALFLAWGWAQERDAAP